MNPGPTGTQSSISPQDRSITYQPEPADYVAANKLHQRIRYRRPWFIIFGACVTLAYLVFLVMIWDEPSSPFPALVVHAAFLYFILSPLVGYFFIGPRQARKLFREHKSLHYPLTLRWSESGLEVQNQQGQATFPWSDLFRWSEDKNILLFYHSSRLFHMLPRRVVSDQQIDDLYRCIKTPKM
jgi:hypothetical protein